MLRPRISRNDIDAEFIGAEAEVAGFVTGAMRDTTAELADDLRDVVKRAGLGDRLANSIRGRTYPDKRETLAPAGWVYARPARDGSPRGGAAGIIDSFARGVTIVPRGGRRFLALPTDDTPLGRRGEPMTPEQVERRFGRALQFVSPADKGFRTPSTRRNGVAFLVLKGLVIRKASGRWRNATDRERTGRTRNPRPAQSVIMFILVPRARMPKRIDLAAVADSAPQRFIQHLQSRWR